MKRQATEELVLGGKEQKEEEEEHEKQEEQEEEESESESSFCSDSTIRMPLSCGRLCDLHHLLIITVPTETGKEERFYLYTAAYNRVGMAVAQALCKEDNELVNPDRNKEDNDILMLTLLNVFGYAREATYDRKNLELDLGWIAALIGYEGKIVDELKTDCSQEDSEEDLRATISLHYLGHVEHVRKRNLYTKGSCMLHYYDTTTMIKKTQ